MIGFAQLTDDGNVKLARGVHVDSSAKTLSMLEFVDEGEHQQQLWANTSQHFPVALRDTRDGTDAQTTLPGMPDHQQLLGKRGIVRRARSCTTRVCRGALEFLRYPQSATLLSARVRHVEFKNGRICRGMLELASKTAEWQALRTTSHCENAILSIGLFPGLPRETGREMTEPAEGSYQGSSASIASSGYGTNHDELPTDHMRSEAEAGFARSSEWHRHSR